MKKISLLSLAILIPAIMIITDCGGGGGGGGGAAAPQATTAIITLSTATIPADPKPAAGTTITDYQVTITLPAGVTVMSSVTPTTDAGVVTLSGMAAVPGTGATVIGNYTHAINILRIDVAAYPGFNAGEFCKVICNINPGSHPQAADFAFTFDYAGGLDISSSTVDLTADLTLQKSVLIQ